MSDDEDPSRDETETESPSGVPYQKKEEAAKEGAGFFTIYKNHQGYWTRMERRARPH